MNFFNTGLIFTPEYLPCKKLWWMRMLEAGDCEFDVPIYH